MSRNKSFDFVVKQVLDNEGVDISSIVYHTENLRVDAVDPIKMSEEYTRFKKEYTDVSAKHSAGSHLNDYESRVVDRWNACQDRCELIVNEIAYNRWYFLREILIVPKEIHTSSDSPFLTDLRTDESFPLSAWMVKVIWAWEQGIPVYCNEVPGMHEEVFIAGMYLFELFRSSILSVRYHDDGYQQITDVLTDTNHFQRAVLQRIEIQTLMQDCVNRITEQYSFMQDVCLDVLRRLKYINRKLWGSDLGYLINEKEEFKDSDAYDSYFSYHKILPMKPKYSGEMQFCGFLSYREFHKDQTSYPFLHFDMMVNSDLVHKIQDLHPIFRIGINLFEFIDQERIPSHQFERLEFLSANLATVLTLRPTSLREDIFNIIGVVDESYEECDHGADLIQASDKLVKILGEYKKRNPSS